MYKVLLGEQPCKEREMIQDSYTQTRYRTSTGKHTYREETGDLDIVTKDRLRTSIWRHDREFSTSTHSNTEYTEGVLNQTNITNQ